MVGRKGKKLLTVFVYVVVHILAAMLVFGCENKSFYDVNRDDINKVPLQMENPENPIPDEVDSTTSETPTEDDVADDDNTVIDSPVVTITPAEPIAVKPVDPAVPAPTKPVQVKPTPAPTKPPVNPPVKPAPAQNTDQISKFIQAAHWVVLNEAKKIGTPCNFYVSRVLELTGFSDDGFLANDFDIYAKEHFRSYKVEDFTNKNLESEQARLKRYLWSYPARTPFILQWTRRYPTPGHIAIVERIGDQLVVYQASMNRHIARREQTSIDRLLSYSRGALLSVYSEFTPR